MKKSYEQVDILANSTPSIILMNCFAEAAPEVKDVIIAARRAEAEALKAAGKQVPREALVNVRLTINDLEVPFVHVADHLWGQLQRKFNDEVEKKAVELVTDAGLMDIANAISEAKHMIIDAFKRTANIELDVPEEDD